MTPQNSCEFLVIHYAPSPGQATGFAWVVLARSTDDPGRPLEVVSSAGWQGRVRPQHREYLEALMADWKQLCGQPAETLFRHADGFSTGPIRVRIRGRSTFADLVREAQSMLAG